ncbi:MAG: hypothetical protein AAF602_16795, partial [Myxococcota bacterium]
ASAALAAAPAALSATPPDRPFLVVITAYGGASITDSVLAVTRGACAAAGGDPASTVVFDDYPLGGPSGPGWATARPVPDSPFHAVSWRGSVNFGQPLTRTIDHFDFLQRHKHHLLAITQTVTSVNHDTAQYRAVTGSGAWRGRTLQEEVAAAHGQSDPLPNVLLTTGSGFVRAGLDDTLDPRFRGELAVDPLLWPLSLERSAAIPGVDPAAVALAARLRDDRLDPRSPTVRAYGARDPLAAFLDARTRRQPELERAALLSKLNLLPPSVTAGFDLARAPEAEDLYARLDGLAEDPVFAQAALAYLLFKHRISTSVTLGPSSANVFLQGADGIDLRSLSLGFDASHTDHWSGQVWMWDRVFTLVDALVDLLDDEPFDDGSSLWDHTVLVVATEFGRGRVRPPDALQFPSGHDLDNGVLIFSPRVTGNRVIGGVDPATTRPYGIEASDPTLRTPDPGARMNESHVYAAVLAAAGVDTTGSGLPDMSGVLP